MKFAHACCALRLVLLSCVTAGTTSVYVAIQLLHGVTFGLFWTTVVDFAFLSGEPCEGEETPPLSFPSPTPPPPRPP